MITVKRFFGGAVFLLMLVQISSPQSAEIAFVPAAQQGVSVARLQRLTALAERYVADERVAGMHLMVNRGGQLVFDEVVGQRSIEDERPLAKDDLYRIYSMTKPITAVAIMQLYESGHFRLSDPITRWLPELKDLKVLNSDGSLTPANAPITMLQLLTHTAGFSYGFNPADPVDQAYRAADLWGSVDLDALVLKVATLPLKFQPGAQWHYSIAVDLTGLIVQRISGRPFDVYLREAIFEPLGMTDTFFEVPDAKRARLLTNHFWDPRSNELKVIRSTAPGLGLDSADDAMSNFKKVSLFSGGGGLVSTARDYMRFAEMLRAGGVLEGERILGTKTLKFMTKNHLPDRIESGGSGEDPVSARFRGLGFGLGFGVIIDSVGSQSLSSQGSYFWGGAAGTIFWVDPEEDLVGLGMIQLMGSPWPFREELRIAVYQTLTDSYEP